MVNRIGTQDANQPCPVCRTGGNESPKFAQGVYGVFG